MLRWAIVTLTFPSVAKNYIISLAFFFSSFVKLFHFLESAVCSIFWSRESWFEEAKTLFRSSCGWEQRNFAPFCSSGPFLGQHNNYIWINILQPQQPYYPKRAQFIGPWIELKEDIWRWWWKDVEAVVLLVNVSLAGRQWRNIQTNYHLRAQLQLEPFQMSKIG